MRPHDGQQIPTEAIIDEARSHLGAALSQMLETDDQVIGQHIRDAYAALGGDPMIHHAQRVICKVKP